jgi:hypothetical protein
MRMLFSYVNRGMQTVLNNPGQFLHLLPVSDQAMMTLYVSAALPSTQVVCEINEDTLETALREADTAAKQTSNDWIRRAVMSKTSFVDVKDIIEKFVSFLTAGIVFVYLYLKMMWLISSLFNPYGCYANVLFICCVFFLILSVVCYCSHIVSG